MCRFSLLAPLHPAVHQRPLFSGTNLSDLEYFLCCPARHPEQRQIQTILDNGSIAHLRSSTCGSHIGV